MPLDPEPPGASPEVPKGRGTYPQPLGATLVVHLSQCAVLPLGTTPSGCSSGSIGGTLVHPCTS